MARVFVDTNVFIYAVDSGEPEKRDIARASLDELAAAGELVTSTQVLQEFYNIAVRKIGLRSVVAERCVREFARNDTVQMSVEIILAGIGLHRSASLSIWDAFVIQAAIVSDCEQLLSEDLQHGRQFDQTVILDPFKA